MQVPQGLQWPLNQLALENGNDDWVEDRARNPSPAEGVFVGSISLQVWFLSILMLYSGCEAPLGPPVASKRVCPLFKIELMAPQKKGAKFFFLSKIGHSERFCYFPMDDIVLGHPVCCGIPNKSSQFSS